MKPIPFPQADATLTAPRGVSREDCGDLPVARAWPVLISCWRLSWRERIAALLLGRVWLHVWSGASQPPVGLMTRSPFTPRSRRQRWLESIGVAMLLLALVGPATAQEAKVAYDPRCESKVAFRDGDNTACLSDEERRTLLSDAAYQALVDRAEGRDPIPPIAPRETPAPPTQAIGRHDDLPGDSIFGAAAFTTSQTLLKAGPNRPIVIGARAQGRVKLDRYSLGARADADAAPDSGAVEGSVTFSDVGSYSNLAIYVIAGFEFMKDVEAGIVFGINVPVEDKKLALVRRNPKTLGISLSRRLDYGTGAGFVTAVFGRHDLVGGERFDKGMLTWQLPIKAGIYAIGEAAIKILPGGDAGYADVMKVGLAYKF